MRIELDIDPQERIEAIQVDMLATGERATEMKPVMNLIVDKILDRNRQAFETRGATTGIYWTPLKGSTVKKKIAAGASNPLSPLRLTDSLMKSLTVRHATYQDLNIDDDGFYLATRHPQAHYHETGTSRMARRPPMTIPAKHAHEYVGMINDFLYGEA